MPLVEAKCTNCGAALRIESSLEAAVCEHCSTPFIVEKAINNYNMSINLSGGVIQMGENSLPQLLLNASTFVRLGDWDSMLATYRRITELYPNNEEGWWGYWQAMSRNGRHVSMEIGKIAKRAFVIVSDPAKRSELEAYIHRYENWEGLVSKWYLTVDSRARQLQETRRKQSRRYPMLFMLVMLVFSGLLYLVREQVYASLSAAAQNRLYTALSFVVVLCFFLSVFERYFRSAGYLSSVTARLRSEALVTIRDGVAKDGITYDLP